jgi:hypothetical protein
MTFKEKIKNLLKQNGISEFVYHSTCYGDGPQLPFAVSTYGIINGLIKFIDFRTIKSITGFEVQNFKSKVLFLKKDGKWIKSSYTIYQAFNNGVCPNFPIQEPYTDETEDEHIYNILHQHFNYEIKKGKDKSFENIRNNVAKQLAHHFYQDVNTCVYIKQLDFNGVKINEDKLKTNYDKPCDITLNITIKPDGSVNIKHVMADNYLKDKVKTLQEEANKRGLKISVEELRQQVIKDFESIETEQSFYKKFIVGWQKLIGEGVANYVEGIQATQKIGKNIWSEGTINHSTWYSKSNEHKEWPEWVQFNPLIGGVLDGTIDEIVGIPVALKGVYEIATDPKKQEALKGVFTKKGVNDLMDGLAKEAKDIANDPEKGQHFAGQTAVSVASMMTGAGFITKTGKIGKITEAVTEGVDNIADPKALRLLDEIKKADRVIPQEKLAKEILEEVGQDAFIEAADELTDIAIKKAKKALSWDEIKEFFKRGNDYNKKAKDLDWYPHHELWLEHPTRVYPPNHKLAGQKMKFRLDSYDPTSNGKIVSRKATTLDEIQFSTFEKYCKEVSDKYPVGAKIARKEDGLGDVLKGEFYLEIPESNKSFGKIEEYIKYAKELDPPVKIIFKPE